jgi:prepilin-type N-terminal cleavage/methylation domain-containing protein/prepilin-type processing-associated H-X9-DG protein
MAHPSSRRRAGRRAFTLIELLVVVAIIATLIGMLLPSLSRARKQAKAVVCLTNMRSLMLAVQMYTDDNDGRFPTAGLTHGGQADDLEKSWVTQIAEEYGKEADVVRCPSDKSPYWKQPLPDGRLRRTSYGSSSYTVYPIGGKPPYTRYGLIPRPAATIFWVELAETGDFAAADHVHPENWWFGDSRELAAREVEHSRHLGNANYALMDGHAEPFRFDKTYKIDPDGGFPPRFLRNKYDPKIAE